MSADEYKTIEQRLKDHIGLDPAALGPKAVERAVSERMRRLGINAISSYAALISTSAEELEALIGLVVIPETWFFRDREPFVFLAHFIRTEWKPEHAQETLRILSAPCATGEEPYSIVMTCLDGGLQQNQFVVDAMDVNAQFLNKARHAVYRRNSFRGNELSFRERYFNFDGHEYSLKPEVRRPVRFFKANFIAPDCFQASAPYNIIFCRNLMIYLHDQARSKIMAVIERLLAPGGLLFIGHAEISPALMGTYKTIRHQGSFALRKETQKQIKFSADAKEFLPPPARRAAVSPTPPSEQPALKAEPVMFGQPTLIAGMPETITHATRLADEGRLGEAAEECSRIIQSDKSNAPAQFLMGLIREAQGDNQRAEECFNRAIYLDPSCADVILHLAMLKEQCGDHAGSDLLRRRAAALNIQGAQSK